MRTPIVGLALMLAAASPARAQQLEIAAPPPVENFAPKLVEPYVAEPVLRGAPGHLDAVQVTPAVAETSTAAQLSAQSAFAIIGVAVVLLGLLLQLT